MKRWTLILSAAAIGVLAASQAQASFQVIRWTSGMCQVLDSASPMKPLTNDYKAVSRAYKTMDNATAKRAKLVAKKTCTM
jgi:hypothetical protein